MNKDEKLKHLEIIKEIAREIVRLNAEMREHERLRILAIRRSNELKAATARQIAELAGYQWGAIYADPEDVRFVIAHFELGTQEWRRDAESIDPEDTIYGVKIILPRITKKGTLSLQYPGRAEIRLNVLGEPVERLNTITLEPTGEKYTGEDLKKWNP